MGTSRISRCLVCFLIYDVSHVITNCLVCFRPVTQIKALRSPQARKNDVPKQNARSQRTGNTGKRPDPRANKKDEKTKPVKKEDKKEDNKVKVWRLFWLQSSALWCCVASGLLITFISQIVVFWFVKIYSLLVWCQCIGETYCLQLQGWRELNEFAGRLCRWFARREVIWIRGRRPSVKGCGLDSTRSGYGPMKCRCQIPRRASKLLINVATISFSWISCFHEVWLKYAGWHSDVDRHNHENTVFWDVMSSGLVDHCQNIGETRLPSSLWYLLPW